MKLKNIAIATIVSIFSILNTTNVNAQSMLTYSKMTNEQIGITALNAVGQNFEIRNAKGKIILNGKIKNNNTFYISIKNLAFGSYSFSINGETLQQFSIN